ncbi:MAG TPA: hypothetical protein VKW76_01645 [Candidatus Binatia bacterium]|nr:hypothetical protein [Candidatus Binatia bacterium]
MRREALLGTCVVALLAGCATVVHGPYQEVRIDSMPAGATVTVAAQASERGPLFIDTEKRTVTTPATVRLLRDNSYRVEVQKPGYKIATAQIVPSYDWVWAPISCGPCEAVGELPTYDMHAHALPVRFLEAAFYEYPKGAVGAFGRGLRIFSPDALLGSAFKLKPATGGYWSDWTGLGTPEVSTTLQPLS